MHHDSRSGCGWSTGNSPSPRDDLRLASTPITDPARLAWNRSPRPFSSKKIHQKTLARLLRDLRPVGVRFGGIL
jgi:hypothetical protein